MRVTFDDSKRQKTLKEHGIDFRDAREVFSGRTLTLLDDREDYGELRYQTYGYLKKRIVMVIWTPRGKARRIISMRYCHEKEVRHVEKHLERSR